MSEIGTRIRSRPAGFLLALAVAGSLASCDAESSARGPTRETLANGATLVRYPDLPASGSVGPQVTEAEADLKFGSLDGDDPNLIFSDIRGIQAAADGTIYVLDFQATDVRAYGPDGRYRQTVVRRGEGPAEITAANGIRLEGDTLLWLHDHGKWTIIGVDLEGREALRFAKPIGSYGYIWDGAFDDRGRYWRHTFEEYGGFTYPPPPGMSTRTGRNYYVSYDPQSETVDSVYLGESGFRSYTYEDPNGIWQFLPLAFEPSDMFELDPSGGFWIANSASYRIVRTGASGDTLIVIEVDLPAQRITDQDRDGYVEAQVGFRPEARRDVAAAAAILADFKPILAGMFVDDGGTLWVERVVPRDANPFYDRFSAEGAYLGSVRLVFRPARGRIWVQSGNIYTWVVDEMDVPYVVRVPVG